MSPPPAPPSGPTLHAYWRRLGRQKDQVLNVRAEALRRRGPLERFLADVASGLAHPVFLLAELAFHLGWVACNVGAVPGVPTWDPYPFPLLTGLASTQALFIGLLILMHSEREARVADLREETDLQVALHAERETTKLLRMVAEVQRALGLPDPERDAELAVMAEPLDPEGLRDATAEQIEAVEQGEPPGPEERAA